MSLDVFRGLTVAAMILVNHPGSWKYAYPPLLHAEWHGWTPTDLIFPFFLFIVGVSLTLSIDRRLSKGESRSAILRHAFWRSLILFGLGLLLNAWARHSLHAVRWPGVLQRIALVSFIGCLILIWFRQRGRAVITTVLLLGYWALMKLVPVPGHGAGDVSQAGNLAAWVDNRLFAGHMWQPAWDPEGILSTIPAIASTLLGAFAGDWFRQTQHSKVARAKPVGSATLSLFAMGAVATIAGRIWAVWFPINKNLWTSSYVLFTAGIAAMLLAACFWIVDQKGWKRWAMPFLFLGANPLAIYVAEEFVAVELMGPAKALLYQRWFVPLASPGMASLLWSLAYLLPWFGIAWLMYRKKIFVKL